MESNSEWLTFKNRFGKAYADAADESDHYNVFLANMNFIALHSSQNYDVGLTRFSDRFPKEISDQFPPMLESRSNDSRPVEAGVRQPFRLSSGASVDWSTTNNPLGRSVVSDVKNQDQCGACWAFTATESTESSVAMNSGTLEELSVQELIDCDKNWDQGCVGGNPIFAYPYIISKGLASEFDYPYTGRSGKCVNSKIKSVSGITGFRTLRSNDESNLALALLQTPVAVGVAGTSPSFLMYRGGVYNDPKCGTTLNHALLLTGFGTTRRGEDYWVAKNSWGDMWGERGYIRIARNKHLPGGVCGVAVAPTFAVGGFGGNSSSSDVVDLLLMLSGRPWLEFCLLGISSVCGMILLLLCAKDCLRTRRIAEDRRTSNIHVEIPLVGRGIPETPNTSPAPAMGRQGVLSAFNGATRPQRTAYGSADI